MSTTSKAWLSPRFTAPYHSLRFPVGALPKNDRDLKFTTADLAHALFSTGRAPGDRLKYGKASFWEWLHRVSVVPAYLRRHYDSSLYRSRLALDLDRSELAAISYMLGQAMTSIFCRKKLGVTHMLHVDRYARTESVLFTPGDRSRPDLFGLSRNGWIVAESKGRTRGADAGTLTKIAQQKRKISSIDGRSPYLTLGCISSFPPPVSNMRLDVIDPDEDQPEPIAISVNYDQYMLAYYSPLLDLIDTADATDRSGGYVSGRFTNLGVEIQLREQIYEQVYNAQQTGPEGLFATIREQLHLPFLDGGGTVREIAGEVANPTDAIDDTGGDERSDNPDGSNFITNWDEDIRPTGPELMPG